MIPGPCLHLDEMRLGRYAGKVRVQVCLLPDEHQTPGLLMLLLSAWARRKCPVYLGRISSCNKY